MKVSKRVLCIHTEAKIRLNSNGTKLTAMARQSAIGSIVDTSLRCSGKAAPVAADVSSGAALMSSHRYNWLLPEANLEALLSLLCLWHVLLK